MVDLAPLFVGANALTSLVGVAAVAVRYATEREPHYWAAAFALAFGGLTLELAVANGFLRETDPVSAVLATAPVGVVRLVALAAWRQGTSWRLFGDTT
ncbi:hypothetical protein [Candidatus Halobonum tyrrellensis]|uniref:Uncharacterized protein n=1 Tax=Candidatus Halobonum tyrrellensis G22 TaxID=1324957 RepID=V4HA22_9EURY|nr:hypothetical protein [Candidatus Halobonum tyrrellensis]ESP87565.1 hypothetical protein K933_13314 [Candidatus Halobonum tyrrellensis G22]